MADLYRDFHRKAGSMDNPDEEYEKWELGEK